MNKLGQILSITAILFFNVAIAKKATYSFDGLTLNGIPFTAGKQAIVKVLGKPSREFKPNYECGFLSTKEQGKDFNTLQFKSLSWTGNDNQGYKMENLIVSQALRYNLKYKGKTLSYQTTQEEFIKLSGVSFFSTNIGVQNPQDLLKFTGNPHLKTTSINLQEKGADDKYIFYFSNGKLCKIEYWSPC